MNYRTAEVKRLAPIANGLRVLSLGFLTCMAMAALAKVLGFFSDLTWQYLATMSGIAFAVFLIGRIRMAVVNAKLERQLEEAP